MKPQSKKILTALAALLLIGAAASLWVKFSQPQGGQTLNPNPTAQPNPSAAGQPASVAYAVTPVVDGLRVPWSLVFPAPDRWLVSERSGAVRIVEAGKLAPRPLVTFGVSSSSEEGLMGLALDPDYATNKLVYACYAYQSNGALADRVVRFTDQGTSAGPPTTLIEGIPAAANHAGCRLSFGPADKKLYITTGDATDKAIAQNLSSLGGKILRLNPDGSLPTDNPFPASPVWSLGHRNAQGLAWQPGTGQLYATEHGPSGFDGPLGGDEVNLVKRGANYGWPNVSHERTDSRYVTPLLVYTPAIAPAGASFYSSSTLPQFTGNLLFAALKGEGVYRAVLDSASPSKVLSHEKIPGIDIGRVRDVQPGPDGSIYLLTSNRDGRGQARPGDDRIYRIAPK